MNRHEEEGSDFEQVLLCAAYGCCTLREYLPIEAPVASAVYNNKEID